MKYVLYLEKTVHSDWEPYDEALKTTKIIGIFRTFKYPCQVVAAIRRQFVDRLVLDDALEEAHYWDHNSLNRILSVTGLGKDYKYCPLDDDKPSYLRIRVWFNVTTSNEETIHYLYTIQETKEYFGTEK